MLELKPYLAPKLAAAGFRHAFFGRVGGLSQGAYSSLNCSYSVGDDPNHVRQNLTRISAHFGLTPDRLITTSQVHGRAVLDFDTIRNREAAANTSADALCCASPNYAMCVRTADCVPVLIGCRATGTVAAIHAGWRGLVAGVVSAAVENLLRKGATPDTLLAAIGPHIGPSAFEVSDDVARELSSAGASAACQKSGRLLAPLRGAATPPRPSSFSRGFTANPAPAPRSPGAAVESQQLPASGTSSATVVIECPGRKPHVRLAGVVLAQLEALGMKAEQVDDLDLCTFSRADEFFSYRRDGQKSGRELSVIVPRS